jgi:hypothetical protein
VADEPLKSGTVIWRQVKLYPQYVALLFWPGRKAPVFNADQGEPGSLEGWSEPELQLLISNGQRQYDATVARLTEVRGRAQNALTIAIALIGTLAATRPGSYCHFGAWVWIAGICLLTACALGAAAIIVVRADMESIHTAVLSTYESGEVLQRLAGDYAGIQAAGESTVATRVTLLWQSVVLLLVGGVLGLIAFLINHH